jgi:hypothetical protein
MAKPRLQYIAEKYGYALGQMLKNDMFASHTSYDTDPFYGVHLFSGFDPTPGKSRTQWMVVTYLNQGFRFEDMERVQDSLTLFERHKRHLPVEVRDMMKIKTLHNLETLLRPFFLKEQELLENQDLSSVEGREKKRLEREKARKESAILREDLNGFTVVIPMTEFAAQWWGRGTKWCTSSSRHNAFLSYHKENPLIISILPDGRKFQMHMIGCRFYFMDAQDNPVKPEEVAADVAYFRHMLDWALSQKADIFKFLPAGYLSSDDVCQILNLDPTMMLRLGDLCTDILDADLCKRAVAAYADCILRVPEKFINQQMCESAVWCNASLSYVVPERFLTRNMALRVLTMSGQWLARVGLEKFSKDTDFVRQAISERLSCAQAFASQDIPADLWPIILDKYPHMIVRVPHEILTQEMAICCAKQGYITGIPVEKLNLQMCLHAVKMNVENLLHVPSVFIADDSIQRVIRYWLRQSPQASVVLAILGLEYLTPKMREILVRAMPEALRGFPEESVNKRLCKIATLALGMRLPELADYMREVYPAGWKVIGNRTGDATHRSICSIVWQHHRKPQYISGMTRIYDSNYHPIEVQDAKACLSVPMNPKLFQPTLWDNIYNQISHSLPLFALRSLGKRMLWSVRKLSCFSLSNMFCKEISSDMDTKKDKEHKKWDDTIVRELKNALCSSEGYRPSS